MLSGTNSASWELPKVTEDNSSGPDIVRISLTSVVNTVTFIILISVNLDTDLSNIVVGRGIGVIAVCGEGEGGVMVECLGDKYECLVVSKRELGAFT